MTTTDDRLSLVDPPTGRIRTTRNLRVPAHNASSPIRILLHTERYSSNIIGLLAFIM
jgi:hypothetical protein